MESEVVLRQFIRESLLERKVKLVSGPPVEYGSKKHIDELDHMITILDQFRRNMGRKDRKERYTISRTIDSLRHLKRKAARENARQNLLKEIK
jgi:hypothetical protein